MQLKFVLSLGVAFLIFMSGSHASEHKTKWILEAENIKSKKTVELGSLNIYPAGRVQFSGQNKAGRIIVKAIGPEGKILGRAESISGIKETPIYIQTSLGLQKILVRWVE